MSFAKVTAPIMVTGLVFAAVWGVGVMTVESSALATKGSLELLRLQLEVTRLQDELVKHSQRSLAKDLELLAARVEAEKQHDTATAKQRPPGGEAEARDPHGPGFEEHRAEEGPRLTLRQRWRPSRTASAGRSAPAAAPTQLRQSEEEHHVSNHKVE